MKVQHTPGPWIAIGTFVGTQESDSQTIAYMDDHRNRRPTPAKEKEANARLIAAAPELLDALIKIVNDQPSPGEDAVLTVEGYNQACKAIAMATG